MAGGFTIEVGLSRALLGFATFFGLFLLLTQNTIFHKKYNSLLLVATWRTLSSDRRLLVPDMEVEFRMRKNGTLTTLPLHSLLLPSSSKVIISGQKDQNHILDRSLYLMSFRDLRLLTENLRVLGYPKTVSLDAFREPNFKLVAELLIWLTSIYEPQAVIPTSVESEHDRIALIKGVAQLFVTKQHIKLNAKKLYQGE